jgi:uncharacterized protein DUF397
VDLTGARWRKSTFSGGGDNEACIEVAFAGTATAFRDSKNPGPVLILPATALTDLVASVPTSA